MKLLIAIPLLSFDGPLQGSSHRSATNISQAHLSFFGKVDASANRTVHVGHPHIQSVSENGVGVGRVGSMEEEQFIRTVRLVVDCHILALDVVEIPQARVLIPQDRPHCNLLYKGVTVRNGRESGFLANVRPPQESRNFLATS